MRRHEHGAAMKQIYFIHLLDADRPSSMLILMWYSPIDEGHQVENEQAIRPVSIDHIAGQLSAIPFIECHDDNSLHKLVIPATRR